MSKAVDPTRVEQEARTRFAELGTVPTVRDERGIEHTPADRYLAILRQARLIAISDGLADAVTAHLAAKGIQAAVDQVRVDPAGTDYQVMAITCTVNDSTVAIPLRPGATTLRLYPATDNIVLAEPPLATIELPLDAVEPDHWVTATTIADALANHLA